MSATWGTLIIADDLTGAADCAGRIVTAGIPVRVVFGGALLPSPRYDGEVVACALDARHASPAECRQRTRGAALAGLREGYETRFIKIDSALRGRPSSLIAGARSVTRHELVVVAPAFPAQRRWTRRGVQEIGGAGERAIGSRYVAVAPRVAADRLHRLINTTTVRAGWRGLATELRRTARRGCDIVIADAETESDLETIAAAGLEAGALLVGSAGLAAGFGAVLAGVAGRRAHDWIDPPTSHADSAQPATDAARILVAAGTHHPATAVQIRALMTHGVSVSPVSPAHDEPAAPVPPERGETGYTTASGNPAVEPAAPNGERLAQHPGAARLARILAAEGRVVAVPANWPAEWETRDLVGFGEAVAGAAEQARPTLLVLTGGDTALAVLTALDGTCLTVEREVAPGIPVARLVDGRLPGLRVVLKSGGFGDESILLGLL